MKTTHTHRGTCQACGARQAVDNATQLVAKHGYKVAGFGFFNGVCQGADHKPAEIEVFLTYRIIQSCIDWATNADRLALLYRTRDLMVYEWEKSVWVEGGGSAASRRYGVSGRYEPRVWPLFGATDAQIDREYEVNVSHHERQASHARAHAKSLRDHVLTRLGKPLYAVADDVKPVKPADGKVDVKTGNIEGAFRTKAAQKSALEGISHEYEKARRAVMDAVLVIEYDDRTEAQMSLYQAMPFDLHNYRAKHGEQVRAVFPYLATTVAEMGRLFALRNEVKARPVVK